MRKKSKKNLKKYFYIGGGALIIATLAFIAGIATVFSSSEQNNQQAEIITVSTLQKIIKVSELSTYTAVYNGITEVTDKENPEDIDYYVSYEAKAYAGIDFDDIDIQVDNEKKEIQVHIPNVDITKIDVDIASMEFIFYRFYRRKSSYNFLQVFIEARRKPVFSMVFPFWRVSSHVSV